MKFSLIICTYQRPQAISTLLNSVKEQTLYPTEILIIDGSTNNKTNAVLKEKLFKNLTYYKVNDSDRGLTKQRNYGILRVSKESEVVCFLDDDTVLENDYFEKIISRFKDHREITGIGGIAINENQWELKKENVFYNPVKYKEIDGFVVKEGVRNILRNYLGLGSDCLPGIMPEFSNGTSYAYPLNGNYYEVDLLIGMAMSFRKIVTDSIKFSVYFEGYGLYEDADYSIRALQFGKNVLDTNVQLEHHHEQSGRPNKFEYGKMVVRNGWYVWRVKYPNPSLKARFKWNMVIILLMKLRFLNVFTTNRRKEAFTEGIGRFVGWISLFLNKPKRDL